MTNELLEQWRKEAEELYPYGKVNIDSYNYAVKGYRNAYIEGCKATHEKMQVEVDNRDKQIRMLNGIIKGYEITLDFLNK